TGTGERIIPYAIVAAALAPPAGVTGLRGAQVELVAAKNLGAWVSSLPSFEARPEDLLTHHRVVERAGTAGAALPVRFGTSLHDRAALRDVLVRREPSLTAALARVGRRRELAVTLEWRTHPDTPTSEDAPDRAPQADTSSGGPGRRFLAERARHWAAAEARRARASHLSKLLHETLGAAGAVDDDIRARIVPAPRIALSCAILTDPSRAEEFMRRVRELADTWDDVRVHLAGPWPPYSFSDTE
ncbi:MAG TPA: GvpL/GvpF family gas vesicle protein, partial [Chloroflexota bacterium]|nr:GvpL/GvpF family gas vesicle protein [Chloroflexota bacterium]